MSAIEWQGRLSECSSAQGLADICNEHIASLTRAEVDELPAASRPRPPLRTDDVNPYPLALIRQLGVGNRASAPALHALTIFFTKAALRLAQMREQEVAVGATRSTAER